MRTLILVSIAYSYKRTLNYRFRDACVHYTSEHIPKAQLYKIYWPKNCSSKRYIGAINPYFCCSSPSTAFVNAKLQSLCTSRRHPDLCELTISPSSKWIIK